MPPLAPRRDATGARILHIEDSAENRMLVRALLEPEGYTVVEAEDGLSGIEAALREVPDLVLLDLNLPGVDGYEVGVILRSFPTLAKTPIVAVTAYAMEGDRQRTLVAGCDGYIPKPIDPDLFPRQVEEFLRGKRERVEERDATPYLRELNQRLVYRLVHQVEELKRLNQQFVRRALQLEDLHGAVQDITSEVGVVPLLERLLPALAGALGMRSLTVELTDPPGIRVDACGRDRTGPAQGAEVPGAPGATGEEREWRLPLSVRGRSLGVMIARHAPAPGATSDEEQLLKIVANQVAIAVENARLYQGTVERVAEAESLVEAGRLLASTLELSEVLHRLAEMVRRRLETDCVVRIWLREIGQPGEFCLHAQAGTTREPPPHRVRVAAGEGLIGGIVYRRVPIVVEDLGSDPRVRNRERVREEGLASFLGVPMLLEDTPVGILTVATRERRVFSDGEVALVEALARSAAVAIWNARLYEETQQRLSQTETLLRVSQAVGSTLDVAEVARRTTRELVRALGADMGGAWRLTPARDRLVPLAGYHVPRSLVDHLAGTPPSAASPLLAALRETGAPVYSSDSAGDPLFDDPLLRLLPHRSVLVVPMRIKEETTGGFALVWTRECHEFRDEELRLVEGMVQQAAIAIENARLLEAEREARESLQVSETRYRELFENAMDLVYVHDPEGRILAFNEAGVRASGYTTGEILQMNIAQLMDAEDHARVRTVIGRMMRGECARELFTFELVRKNGTRAILECAARVIRRDGTPVAVQGVARDITERRKLEQRQAAFVEIVKELAAEDDFDRLFSLIGRRVCELVEADSAVISLVEGDDIVFRGSYGVDDPTLLTPRRRIAESRVGRVLAEKRAFACPDTAADPHWHDSVVVQRLGYRALIDVPIILRGEVIGVLGVLYRSPRAFSEEDVALLTSLAEHTAVAFDRTNLLRKLEARLRETETLLSVSQAAGSVLDATEIARRTIREMVRALGADVGGAWRRAPAGDRFMPVAGYRVPPEVLPTFAEAALTHDLEIVQAVLTASAPVFVADSQADPRLDAPFFRALPHRSVLMVPMTVKGEMIGGFAVAWTRQLHQLSADELRLVEGIARQAAIALENARLLEAEREARERLAVSETRYRELFENVIDIVYLHDLEGRILAINEAGVRASGYSRAELLGTNLADLLRPTDVRRTADLIERMLAGERPVESFTAELVSKDGHRLLLECVGRAVCKDGRPVAVLGSARDITVRARLERRQEALVALSRQLATEVDIDRLLPRIAEEARRLMGMHAAVVLLLEGDELVFRGAAGLEPGLPIQARVDVATSLTGVVVREHRPLIRENLALDPAWAAMPIVMEFGYRSMLAVPITLKDQTLGVLKLLHREPRPFPEEEIDFLRALATQAALAIDNARLFAAQREEAEVSASLLRLAAAIEVVQDLDQVLDTVVRTTAQLMGMSQCALFLLDPSDESLIPAAAFGLPEEHRAAYLGLRGPARIPAVVRAVETQEPVVTHADQPDFGVPRSLARTLGIRSMLVIPLVSGGRLMGTMAVHTPGAAHTFTAKEIALARGIAAHAAVAIDKARLFQQTQARLRETETLLAVTQALSSTLDPTETMRRVAREIARTLGADMVGAYLADAAKERLHPIAGYRVPQDLYERFMRYPIPIQGHPAMEEAWQRRQTVWWSDAARDGRLDPASVQRFPHQSALFVPMTVKDEPIGGFFVVWWKERRQFTPEEVRLVAGISDQAAMFIENARLYSEATRRRREAEELARLARMLTESLDAADVGERIVESSLQLLGGRFSVLRLLQPDGMLKLIASRGDPRVLGRLLPLIPSGVGVVGRAATSGAPAWSADVFADAVDLPEDMRAHIEALGLRAYLAVPLRVKRQIIGVIGICDETGRRFSDAEVALLQTFADQAAIALENSRLYGDLRAALRAVEESQQRIVQGERLRALGEMAGGVAHDFNNVLAIIVGRAEVLLNETEDPELQRQLDVIIKVALDAAQTVKRIQEFTRMRRARPFQPVHVHQLVNEVVEITRSRWKDEAQSRGIRYDVVVEANPTPAILGDPSEIREALTNILFNAFDAMPDGGRVILRTGVEGGRVFCSIEDTGIGMSEDVRQRIFDPFFTTKGERGTGLGLSVVYGIVTRHNGELDVQSRPGAGTTFVIRFPAAGEAAVEQPIRQRRQSHAQARGRILVIDDERDVADILGDVLTRDGHQVVVCSDGAAGLARFEREEFDLVITDLGMPGMSGWEVARLVKLARPGLPVVMITGWGDRIDPAEAVSRGVDVLVSKPFKRDQIREVVNAALGGAPAPTARAGQRPPLPAD